ncbi:MAG: hypothetical protein RBU23_08640 [Candidatus Auribacterota bacterium]|nr:hypothetical protein [Candidatus Auribacterota bacterium]
MKQYISEKYGSVDELRRTTNSDRWIFLLRDAHFNIDAQRNIASILNQLYENGQLDCMYMEGACGTIDTTILKKYPHAPTRNNVADYLLEKSYINGVEYFISTCDNPLYLEGIEDAATYAENLEYLKSAVTGKNAHQAMIDQLIQFVKINKKKVLSIEMLDFERWREQYHTNQFTLTNYCIKLRTETNVDLSAYKNISLLLEADALLQKIEHGALAKEETSALSYLSVRVTDTVIQQLFSQRLSSHIRQSGLHIFYRTLLDNLNQFCDSGHLFKNIVIYSKALEIQRLINLNKLDSERKELEYRYIQRFAQTDSERFLYRLEERTLLLQQFFDLTMNAQETRKLLDNKSDYTEKNLLRLVAGINPEIPFTLAQPDICFDAALENVANFYRLALDRDQILAGNALAKMEKINARYSVVFTGGFHTQGMIDYFSRHNINIAVIKPFIPTESLVAVQSDGYMDSFITTHTKIEAFINKAINAIAIPRWLSSVPIGISENEKNIKMVETATYLMSLHAEHILQGDIRKASPEVIETVNTALRSMGISHLNNVSLQAIRRYPQYREYELMINGKSLFFYFTNRTENFLWKTIAQDMQSVLTDTDIFTGSLWMSVADTPVKMVASPARDQQDILTDEFIAWAREQSVMNTSKTHVAISSPAVITVTRDAADLVVSLVALDRLSKEKNVVYQDRIPASNIYADFIIRMTQSILDTFSSAYSISPQIVVINPDTGASAVVDSGNPSLFAQQTNPLLSSLQKHHSEEESFSDFPFETTLQETKTITDKQLIEKFIRHAKRQNSYKPIISLVKKASNKRLLTILSSPEFYQAMVQNFSSEDGRTVQYTYTLMIHNILSNSNTPSEALLNILKNNNFTPLIMRSPFLPSYGPLHMLAVHKSAGDAVLDMLADRIIEITSQPQGILSRGLSLLNRYLPVYRLMNNVMTQGLLKFNLMPRFATDFMVKTFARMSALDIIEHPAVRISTVQKLYTDTHDIRIAMAIGRSAYPSLVADHPSSRVRNLVIHNPNTSVEKLMGYMHTKNSPELRDIIAGKLARHPQLTENTIAELSGYSDTGIVMTLFDALHDLKSSAQSPDYIDQKIAELWDSIEIMIPKLNQKDLLRLAEILLNIKNPFPEMRIKIDAAIRNLGINNPALAVMTAASKNYVNARTIEDLLHTYMQEKTFDQNVLIAIAGRSDITMHIVSLLEPLNNRPLIQALLANERITPIFADEDFQKLTDRQIPLRISQNEFMAYIEDKRNDIAYLREMAKKATLKPNILIMLHRTGDPRILAEFAAKKDLPVGIAEILANDSHPIPKALLLLNPVTPAHVVQKIARYALSNSGHLFNGMTVGEMDYFLTRFPALTTKDRLIGLALRHSATLMSADLVESYVSHGLSQPICTLISQSALEVSIASRAGNYEEAFIKMAPFIFKGIRMWESFDEDKFYSQLVDAKINTLHADLTPVGSLIHFANAAYSYALSVQDSYPERAFHAMRLARELYSYSHTNKNNPAALIAMAQLNENGRVDDEILNFHNIAQIMTLDLHNAQPFTVESSDELKRFYRIPYETFSYENRLLVTLATLMLRDAIHQGLLSSHNALIILNDFLESNISPDKWEDAKKLLIKKLVRASNLTAETKEDLLAQNTDLTEFFVRRGARGMMTYHRYKQFYENLIIENMPEYLHADMARTIWFELMNVTENQLFVEPHYVTHLQLIRHNGEVIIGKDSFKISFPVINLIDVGPSDSTVRAEIGHLIDFALFRNSSLWSNVYYAPFGEFQDRAAMQYLPHQLSDSVIASPIVDTYSRYDNNLIGLFEEFAKRARTQNQPLINYLQNISFNFQPEGLNERFFSRNTIKILHETADPNMLSSKEKRIIGEFIFHAVQNDPAEATLIEPIRSLRTEIANLPWNIRAFFEGGTYLSTYGSAYTQLSPPLHPITGNYAHVILDSAEEHIGGEWLSFYFRTHVRELLRNGRLTADSLPQFYRTAVYYLRTVVYKNGSPPDGKKVVDAINNLTPEKLFDDIQNRSIKGHIVTSAQNPVSGDAVIAAPEKLLLNAFARVLNHLFFSGTITFKQLGVAGLYFVKSVYPELSKISIDTAKDLSRKTEILESFAGILYDQLRDAFQSYQDVRQQVLSIIAHPFNDAIQADQQPFQITDELQYDTVSDTLQRAGAANPAVDTLFDTMPETTRVVFDTSYVVIDFDNVFHIDNPVQSRELLMAFRLMFHSSYSLDSQSNTMEQQAKRIIFYSPSLSQEQIAAFFTAAGIDANLFTFLGNDAPDIADLGLKRYLLLNNGIMLNNTILISTSGSGAIKDMFVSENAVVFDTGHSADFYSLGVNLRVLFDLLRHNVLPNNLKIISVRETSNPQLSSIVSANSSFSVEQLIDSSSTDIMDFSRLAGMVVTVPVNQTPVHQPRPSSILANKRFFDEAL